MMWWMTGRILAVGVLGLGVIAAEAVAVTMRGYLPAESAPPIDTITGEATGAPLRLAILGDSTAAGLGVSDRAETVAGRIATGLAADGRRVTVDSVAESGARAGGLNRQVSRAMSGRPHIAVILIGANDATHWTRLSSVERDLGAAVQRLRKANVLVVVGTCPDMGAARAFARPLRDLVGWRGRRVADVEIRGVQREGGVAIDLAAQTGPVFRADPATLSKDLFHPSADGYRLWAAALLPAIRQSLGSPTVPGQALTHQARPPGR